VAKLDASNSGILIAAPGYFYASYGSSADLFETVVSIVEQFAAGDYLDHKHRRWPSSSRRKSEQAP
jgi:hypothetical protein